jgi:transcriptional regulator with XRE-family HTH domain
MARAAIRLSVRDVAERLAISPNTLTKVEAGGSSYRSTLATLRRFYEGEGLVFVEGDGMGPGVRLKQEPEADTDEDGKGG